MIYKELRADLVANTNRVGALGFVVGWLQSPGFAALAAWRIASRLFAGGPISKFISLIIWRKWVYANGCDISLKAKIGSGLRLPHALGIVIGEGVTIGSSVTIYQNVTLGRRSASTPQYPIICDHCILYTGCLVTGNVTVGVGALVPAYSVIVTDVPARDPTLRLKKTSSESHVI